MTDLIPPNSALSQWIGRLQERLTIPQKYVFPLVAVAAGYKDKASGSRATVRVSIGRTETAHLYYNGVIFVRIMFPFFVAIMVRWAGSDPTKREYLQTHVGWRLSGIPAIAFRIQSDLSAASGYESANTDQVTGWDDGGK